MGIPDMVQWLIENAPHLVPAAIVVAIATCSFVVVLMGVLVSVLNLFGFRTIKRHAGFVAREIAGNAVENYMNSGEFEKLVRREVANLSTKAFVSQLHENLMKNGGENG